MAVVTSANLFWETAHLPLYTLWEEGSLGEKILAVVHCTGGDFLIAAFTLGIAILIVGAYQWPARRFFPVACITTFLGVSYTAFSEWLNVAVKSAWAYSDLMPVITAFGFDFGVSPLLQWIVIPVLGFFRVKRWLRSRSGIIT